MGRALQLQQQLQQHLMAAFLEAMQPARRLILTRMMPTRSIRFPYTYSWYARKQHSPPE